MDYELSKTVCLNEGFLPNLKLIFLLYRMILENDGQIILDLELTEKIHNHFLY
jgi:hypothetical protein